MSLFKKTLILNGPPPKGYLTALKIGATRGIKLTLDTLRPEMTLAVRIGSGETEAFPVRALKEEFRVREDFDEKTELKAVVFEREAVFAYTGPAPSVRYGEWIKTKQSVSEPDAKVSETPKTDRAQSGARPEAEPAAQPEPKKSGSGGAVYFEPVLKREETAEAPIETDRTAKPVEGNAAAAADRTAEPVDAEVVGEAEKETFGFFKKQTEDHFYDRVRARMDEMFVVHPKEESLEKLIPDSKWIRIPYSQDEFYVVGVLTDAGRVTHIGYGVKGLRSVFPPKEAEALSEFLPTAGDEGYWLMFQDAETGEMLPIE